MSIDWWNFPSLYADFASVFKLHGSCNFVPRDVQATRDVGYTNAASFPGPAKAILNEADVRKWLLGNNGLPPVMCLYMKDKPAQAGSSTIEALQQRWREVVGEASKVVIIGVRPNDQDHHLWDAVAETHATIAFVGDEEVINEWADARRRGRPTAVLGSRFADALPQVIGALT